MVLPERKKRVLVIDDDGATVRAHARVLGDRFDCTERTKPFEALASIASGARYDAIVCDRNMPELDGVELRDRIAAISEAQARRLIFVSAEPMSAIETRGNASFVKPISKATLLAAVELAIAFDGEDESSP